MRCQVPIEFGLSKAVYKANIMALRISYKVANKGSFQKLTQGKKKETEGELGRKIRNQEARKEKEKKKKKKEEKAEGEEAKAKAKEFPIYYSLTLGID